MNQCHVIGQASLTSSDQNNRAGPSDSNQTLLIEASPSKTGAGEERAGRKTASVSKEEDIYFKFRKNWSNESISVLSKIEGEPLAEGIIILPFANSCIDEVEVEEVFAGVLVARACDDVDEQLLLRDLPKFIEEDPRTVQWPVLRLRFIFNSAILANLYKVFVDSESSGKRSETQEEEEKRKRPTIICPDRCMTKVNKKDVLEERSFYYNEPFARRAAYILSKVDHPGFKEDNIPGHDTLNTHR
ncbi:hypothetical protein R1sor_011489 [Riccia sorocarpa]|uniref:Uncharacterized protein n=1 Tax=Riccia sorocarpa TaxID=122646 RepID=A0ABD3I140_9MARC